MTTSKDTTKAPESAPRRQGFNLSDWTDEAMAARGETLPEPEPDITAYAEALDEVAHKAAAEHKYDLHKVGDALHVAERNAYYADLIVRGLVAMAGGIQAESDPLVAPRGGMFARMNAQITSVINAVHPDPIPYGEFDLAGRFRSIRGGDYRCCGTDDWRVFDGTGWRDGAQAHLAREIETHCKRMRVAGQRKDPPITPSQAQAIESGAMIRKIESLLRSGLHTEPEEWDADHFLLGTPSGVVDLKTAEFHRGRRDLIVKRTPIDPAPPFPDGAFLDDYAPHFASFLDWATEKNDDLIYYLQRAAGYTLTGDFSEQCLFFLLGKTNSGKGTWMRILHGILGPKYSKPADKRVFTEAKPGYERHSTELAALNGMRMASFQEPNRVYTWDPEKVKAMTGGDDLTARFIRENNTVFKPTFKFWFAANLDPVVRHGDAAMRRRLHLIPFNAQIGTVDTLLEKKLEGEYPAILRWMINGCLAWQKSRDLGGSGLAEPHVVTDAVAKLFDEAADALDDWIAECCTTGTDDRDYKERLYASWKDYAERHGELKSYPSATMMGKGLEERGYRRDKDSRNRRSIYRGIRVK